MSDDPFVEPANSTVDDWLGQSVERDRRLAERLVDDEGGDEEAAERRFDDEATGADEQRRRLHPEDEAGGRGGEPEETGPDPDSPGGTMVHDLPQAEPNEPG